MAQKNAISDSLMNHQGRPVKVDTSIPQQHIPAPQLYCDMPIVRAPRTPIRTPTQAYPTGAPSAPGGPYAPSGPSAPPGPSAPSGPPGLSDREQFSAAMEAAFTQAGFQVQKKSLFAFALSNGAKQEIVDTETVYYMWRNNLANGQNVIDGFVKRKLNDFSR